MSSAKIMLEGSWNKREGEKERMRIFLDVAERGQIGFQEEVTPIMIGIKELHDRILYYLILIVSLVSYILIKLFQKQTIKLKNKYLTHSTVVELI
jgi:hypothetical protein